ncbi:flavodoxin domain-containing protein [Actinacidiphila sp. ITFR-21]|uniref:flavodoxin domain-containing protein n=1 Tax=Actinacidiphila sp. ITFR-21 TaxID=3075199 RepID=UPI00288910B9|nr:flavodoxin domain-containing protein [Streptomyces sp. ITFR-21]WNI14330.1 flavodoxin domain-containing protein [Streptomyces sp. ITFR-21]
MAGPRILVVYASRNGSTAQIAGWIAGTAAERGVAATVRPAAEVGDISGYDAVVLGSGVYAGRWLKDARRFARHHRRALLEVPVWLFSSGPLDDDAAERAVPPLRNAARITERLDAADHVTFGGRLVAGAPGFVARQLLGQGRAGDHRDRGQIRAWAVRIADGVAAAWHQLI